MMPSYSEYKDSGIEWIGKIPAGWEVKRFCHLFSFSHGVHITKNDFREKGVLCVTYGDIHSKGSSELNSNTHGLHSIDPAFLENEQNAKLKKGDFIFADTSEDIEGAGKFTYLNSDITIMAGYHTIIAKPQHSESTRFLSYFFDSLGFRSQIHSRVYGVKVFSITKLILKNTRILLPPLPEQEAIAAYLDEKLSEIDTAVSNLQIQAEKLHTYKQQLIAETVMHGLDKTTVYKDSGIEWIGKIPAGWKVYRLKNLVKSHEGGIWGLEPHDKENNIICIRVADFNFEKFSVESHDYTIRNYITDQIKSFKLQKNAILIEKSGGGETSPVGKTVIFDHDWSALYANFIEAIYPTSAVDSKFLLYFFITLYYAGVNKKYIKQTTGIQNLDITSYLYEKVPLPPLPEQEAIAAYLDEKTTLIDTLIADIHRQIEQLKKYRKIIIHDAVTGRVKVPEVQNESY